MFHLNRLSGDFVDKHKIKVQCRQPEALLQSKTLKMNFRIRGSEKCLQNIGHLTIHEPDTFRFYKSVEFNDKIFTNVVLKPHIATADESLRKYSPKV